MTNIDEYDLVIIGGGFYGLRIALHLKDRLKRILVLEKEDVLMTRASYVNQARVHNGYHYPRSLLTALSSRINYPKFVSEYGECISGFDENYYAISKNFSKVTSKQFQQFCHRIDAQIRLASSQVKKMFNDDLVEEVFSVEECVFDAIKLRDVLTNQIEKSKITIIKSAEVIKIAPSKSCLVLQYKFHGLVQEVTSRHVINATYGQLNNLHQQSGLPIIKLKHELTEMVLVDVPPELKSLSITMMCGPFFSLMPFPSKNMHTLSHVRYTPHYEWLDSENSDYSEYEHYLKSKDEKTSFPSMIRDASRYLPILQNCKYGESLWEIKTVLPQSEMDDSRPIMYRENHGYNNYTCIMGGKIDNIYDVLKELDEANFS